MAVVVSDNKGYTQDEFKEYLKTTIASINSDVATNASNASTSETNASNYAKQAKDSASAASGAEDSAHQYSSSALQSATNASASEANAKTSETNASTSATNAENSNQSAKKWAESSSSPDGANDTDSSTGKTQSAKSWALAAKASEANAKTSETNAANSARTLQADWNATDTTLQSYIKNKPDVITFKSLPYEQTASYEKNTVQSIANGLPSDFTNTYQYGVLMTIGDYNSEGCLLLYAPHNNAIMYKSMWSGVATSGWRISLDTVNFYNYALPVHGNADTATKATQDASGNNIVNTYARKDNASITNLTVTGQTSVPTANQGNSSNAIASTEFVAKSISALVNGAPEQLNTLNELATALGNDSNFSATITAELGKKLDESEASDTYVTKTLWKSSEDDMGSMLYQFTNQLQRNKTYSVGDIAYSPSLPSWAYLECITAGTTGASDPDFSSVSTSGGAIADMTDGAVHWRVRDTRCRYEVGDIIAKTTTPKSYEYLLPCDGSAFDKTKYPLLAKVFSNGKVPDLTDGRFLEGSTDAGTSKNAGLPNITATVINHFISWTLQPALSVKDGAVYVSNPNNKRKTYYANVASNNGGEYTGDIELTFDLNKGNSIYGASNTVQPKAFTVMYYVCYGG